MTPRSRAAAVSLAVVLAGGLLAGCGAGRDLSDRSGGGLSMEPWRDRVDARDRGDDRAGAAEDAARSLEDCADPDDAAELEGDQGDVSVTVHVPADSSDDHVEDLEDFREDTDAGPVCWVVVEVDNRDGTEVVDLPEVDVVAADGSRVTLQRASDVLSTWAERSDDDDAVARAVELITQTGGTVSPGQEGYLVLLAAEDLDDPRAAHVRLTDGGDVLTLER
ncbi:hypothetical protein [Pseudokineococcus lusitanus]|uniref:DUF4352 domain-containing protein n=1 Tax=Pseudokineococcus lusitanus TaxID=763993 RepID=A0A3N1HTX3_9ACTN|nr:hypothetical protein [Pseudokineococcus lusitanus]ROP45978.1 hypothetical protein EDC03_0594 [Pseudokineococcus lusitanus]